MASTSNNFPKPRHICVNNDNDKTINKGKIRKNTILREDKTKTKGKTIRDTYKGKTVERNLSKVFRLPFPVKVLRQFNMRGLLLLLYRLKYAIRIG